MPTATPDDFWKFVQKKIIPREQFVLSKTHTRYFLGPKQSIPFISQSLYPFHQAEWDMSLYTGLSPLVPMFDPRTLLPPSPDEFFIKHMKNFVAYVSVPYLKEMTVPSSAKRDKTIQIIQSTVPRAAVDIFHQSTRLLIKEGNSTAVVPEMRFQVWLNRDKQRVETIEVEQTRSIPELPQLFSKHSS